MAASIRVTSHHGSSDDGSTTDVQGSTLYFRQSDSDASGGNVPHNGAGFNYSWVKNMRLYVQSAPIKSVTNLKAYWSTATQVTNIDILMKRSATYVDPTTQTTTPITGAASAYSYLVGAPLSLSGSFLVGTDTAPKQIGDFTILQTKVGDAAVANDVPLGSLIYRWDEQ